MAMGTKIARRTDLQHRQALFRGRAAGWDEGSGEEDIGRHMEVRMDQDNRPYIFYRERG